MDILEIDIVAKPFGLHDDHFEKVCFSPNYYFELFRNREAVFQVKNSPLILRYILFPVRVEETPLRSR